jgi:hypothetical protein
MVYPVFKPENISQSEILMVNGTHLDHEEIPNEWLECRVGSVEDHDDAGPWTDYIVLTTCDGIPKVGLQFHFSTDGDTTTISDIKYITEPYAPPTNGLASTTRAKLVKTLKTLLNTTSTAEVSK